MKLSTKILSGFIAINMVVMALSTFIFFLMRPVKEDLSWLETSFSPLMGIVSDIQYGAALENSAYSTFGFTADKNTLAEARKHGAEVRFRLDLLREASSSSAFARMPELGEAISAVNAAYARYSDNAAAFVSVAAHIDGALKDMEEARRVYRDNGLAWLVNMSRSGDGELESALALAAGADEVLLAARAAYMNGDPAGLAGPREAAMDLARRLGALALSVDFVSPDGAMARRGLAEMEHSAAGLASSIDSLQECLRQRLDFERGSAALLAGLSDSAETLAGVAGGINGRVAARAAEAMRTAALLLAGGLASVFLLSGLMSCLIIRNIAGCLNHLVSVLDDDAHSVEDAAGRLGGAAQMMAEGSARNSAGLEEAATALSQVSSMTMRGSDNVSEARGVLEKASESAARAGELLGRAPAGADEEDSRVREMTACAAAAYKVFLEVQEQVGRVNEILERMASDSQEQASGIKLINEAIGEVDRVTRSGASAADDVAASAVHLSGKADDLIDAVNDLSTLVHGAGGVLCRSSSAKSKLARKVEVKALPVAEVS
ncbi:hypothetical protein C4J81_15575 [Deltaproteobacteria bacterium Smac51]|nr:hypothetical protein C4J81_15575 [Deltaproteobacteria bacterium Smac51]